MKARSKFLVGGAVILAAAGYLMTNAIAATGQYYLTPTELATRVAADPTFYGTGVKVGAKVVPGSIVRDPADRLVTFAVTDGRRTYPVRFHGITPDTFTDGVTVVLEGRLARDGTFQATTVLAKCASRYQNAPTRPGTTPAEASPALLRA